MRIEIPLEPQAAKRPKVNSMVNSTYYDTSYRKWLNEAMGWVENYLIETDFALLEELLGKSPEGEQYKNTHVIRGFKKIADIGYRFDEKLKKNVVKTRNVAVDENGQVIVDDDGFVLSLSGQRIPILGELREDYLGIRGRMMLIISRRNNRESKATDRPFPLDSNTGDYDNYAKAVTDAFFETPMFKETGLNDRHIQEMLIQKRYVSSGEKPGILLELKPM